MSEIQKLDALEILDSRGNPTLAVSVTLSNGVKATAVDIAQLERDLVLLMNWDAHEKAPACREARVVVQKQCG